MPKVRAFYMTKTKCYSQYILASKTSGNTIINRTNVPIFVLISYMFQLIKLNLNLLKF